MRPKEIKLDQEDLSLLFADDPGQLMLSINNVFCGRCTDHQTSITDFEIYLNDLNDIILQGKCIKCGGPVGRYLETGENPKYVKIARRIRKKKAASGSA